MTDRQKNQKCSADAVAVRLNTTADVHAVASLRYGESVRLPAETMGCQERILSQWLGDIDNNLCENVLRVVALGRRNYMFFGYDGGGDSRNPGCVT